MKETRSGRRVAFVDYGKGLSIILVVMMHSVLGVEAAFGQQGWLHPLVEFAGPFRTPAFFLIAGLFVARTIDSDWRSFFDRKILHFAYFYALWLTIQFAFRMPGFVKAHGLSGAVGEYFFSYVEPFGTLWFIYLLPVFFIVTRMTRALPPYLVWLAATLLEIVPIETHWTVIDEFCSRFVYFYTGYIASQYVFSFAQKVEMRPLHALPGLAIWGAATAYLVHGGWAGLPLVSLALGMAGAAALVTISALLATGDRLAALRYCGLNSLVIYLAFFLPMAATREFLLRSHLIADVGAVSLLVTCAAVVVPLALHAVVRNTRFRFLFERPDRFRLSSRNEPAAARAIG